MQENISKITQTSTNNLFIAASNIHHIPNSIAIIKFFYFLDS